MAETTKLSVEKALEKLHGKEPSKSKNERNDEKWTHSTKKLSA